MKVYYRCLICMKQVVDHDVVTMCKNCPHVQRHKHCVYSMLHMCPICGSTTSGYPVTRSCTQENRKNDLVDLINASISLFKQTAYKVHKFEILNYIYNNLVRNFSLIYSEIRLVKVAIKKLDEFATQGWTHALYFKTILKRKLSNVM